MPAISHQPTRLLGDEGIKTHARYRWEGISYNFADCLAVSRVPSLRSLINNVMPNHVHLRKRLPCHLREYAEDIRKDALTQFRAR
jgi:hypothetical protein